MRGPAMTSKGDRGIDSMAKKASEKKKRRQKKEQPSPSLAFKQTLKRKSRANRAFIDCCEIPAQYNQTGVALIAKDPSSVYAYWEITPSSIQEARSRLRGNFKKSIQTLRVFDVTDIDFNGANANRQFDVDIDSTDQCRYIILPNDKATVCADLGFRTPAGVFYSLARSNIVSTPSADRSDRLEITWAKVSHKQGSKPCVVAQTLIPTSDNHAKTVVNLKDSLQLRGDIVEEALTPSFPGNTPDLNPVGSFNESDSDLSLKAMQTRGRNEESTMASIFGDALDFGVADDLRGSENTSSFMMHPASADEKSFFSADNAHLSSETSRGGASEQRRPRGFRFQLDAELIVYGRTEPGAQVTIDGHGIELRNDGTFTRRLAFPEGVLPLQFSARPADGSDEKNIALTVGKTTIVYP
jgi:hypothetical protein